MYFTQASRPDEKATNEKSEKRPQNEVSNDSPTGSKEAETNTGESGAPATAPSKWGEKKSFADILKEKQQAAV